MMDRLKREAETGSLNALCRLSLKVNRDSTVFPSIIAAIRHHLLSVNLPTTFIDPGSDSEHLRILKRVHESLSALMMTFAHHVLDNPRNVALVANLWPDLSRWIIPFLQTYIVEVPNDPSIVRHEYVEIMIDSHLRLLKGLFQTPQISSAMKSPGLISCLMKVWVSLMASGTEFSRQEATMLVIMGLLYQTGSLHDDEAFNAVTTALYTTSPDKVTASLMGLINLVQQPAASTEHVMISLAFLEHTTNNSLTFRRNHLAHHSIHWVCRLMERITSRKPDFVSSFEEDKVHVPMVGMLRSCAGYLATCFEEGSLRVVQALERHLLDLLLKCIPFFSTEDPSAPSLLFSTIVQILDLVNSYLIYRGVLREVRRSMQRIQRSGLEGNIHMGPETIRDAWSALKKTADKRWAIRCVMVNEEVDKCENRNCPPDGINHSKRAVKCCQGCQASFYCSRECQKQAWVSHRPLCQKIKCMKHDGSPTMISARDTLFLITVAENDIYEHLEVVKDLREKNEHQLKHPLVISLDYVSIPMAITMKSAAEYRDRESAWDRAIQKVETQGGQLVFLRYPHAVKPREGLLRFQIDV
ncbi:uncharacterized protein EV420DRAFT_1592111 [Desarmillaria tabescens]|uniref:MYND-type domain-containing protein n=1 Tax=Armillaria tabescens TaxID=1929756 RepID=A0AA39J465_ARMTA|nr:uncharacterized protein EV420DRAFT_1592111 [Desarmillaria tabescens]KAK0435817.1 hypothetical protein EV420DRAFT_1592111 [Desarmillaria tabescens]